MTRAILLLLLAACATSHKAELDQTVEVRGEADVDVDRKTETGPTHEVFEGTKTIPSAIPGRRPAVLRGKWTTDTGPSLEDLNAKSREVWKKQQTTQLTTASTMKPALSCAVGGWLVTLAVIAVALFAWRLLRRV